MRCELYHKKKVQACNCTVELSLVIKKKENLRWVGFLNYQMRNQRKSCSRLWKTVMFVYNKSLQMAHFKRRDQKTLCEMSPNRQKVLILRTLMILLTFAARIPQSNMSIGAPRRKASTQRWVGHGIKHFVSCLSENKTVTLREELPFCTTFFFELDFIWTYRQSIMISPESIWDLQSQRPRV